MAVGGFQKAIAGSATQISATSLICVYASIQADPTNANTIVIGGSDVDANKGVVLNPGDALPLGRGFSNSIQLNAWYGFANNAGDKVRVVYEQL